MLNQLLTADAIAADHRRDLLDDAAAYRTALEATGATDDRPRISVRDILSRLRSSAFTRPSTGTAS